MYLLDYLAIQYLWLQTSFFMTDFVPVGEDQKQHLELAEYYNKGMPDLVRIKIF